MAHLLAERAHGEISRAFGADHPMAKRLGHLHVNLGRLVLAPYDKVPFDAAKKIFAAMRAINAFNNEDDD